jgi:catechol 2,3-dioxygenase-like lactoylglutathione lyase family enzyme
VVGEDPPPDVGPMTSVCLNVSDLSKSVAFWVEVLGFLEIDRGDDFVTLSCAATSATLRLHELGHGEKLQRGSGYGRLALGCQTEDLEARQEAVAAEGSGGTVLTSMMQLDTPGKASVVVVIVADPDGHEICLVGEEGFKRLSRLDEAAPQLLGEAIAKDSSLRPRRPRKRRRTGRRRRYRRRRQSSQERLETQVVFVYL